MPVLDRFLLADATAMEPLVIEMRCNENRMRTGAEPVPYGVEEIVADAVATSQRGATVFHFHARDADSGKPQHTTDAYRETMRAVKAETELIVHPTTGYTDATDPAARVRPILELHQDPRTRPDMAALAFGVTNLDRWNEPNSSFVPGELVYQNTRSVIEQSLDAFAQLELPIISVCWELSHVRTALRYRQAGRHAAHRLWQFALTGGDLVAGPSPTVDSLVAMRAAIPHGEPWMVWCQGGDAMAIAALAVAMGGHVGIGLGDHDYSRLGGPSNADLVEMVVELAGIVGRPIANPEQARQLLDL